MTAGLRFRRFPCAAAVFCLLCCFGGSDGRAASTEKLLSDAAEAGDRGDHDAAIKLATLAIEQTPTEAAGYYVRGRERFRAGQVRESVADFDQYVVLRPDAAPRQWERGIACYYAGMFEGGAKQFESYQKFDGQDVENSVWRFLCLAPTIGVQRAQATMLPIDNDRRVPMMQVYAMFQGKTRPEDVLSAVRADNPDGDVLAGRLFYAHLYLGLWYHATGNKLLAKRYIELSADESLKSNRRINRYMWDVARVHRQLLGND